MIRFYYDCRAIAAVLFTFVARRARWKLSVRIYQLQSSITQTVYGIL